MRSVKRDSFSSLSNETLLVFAVLWEQLLSWLSKVLFCFVLFSPVFVCFFFFPLKLCLFCFLLEKEKERNKKF